MGTQLRAITKVAPGDELTWCYPGAKFPIEKPSVEARRSALRNGFEFECHCVLCDATGDNVPTYGALCRRAIGWGKPPPKPPGGFKKNPGLDAKPPSGPQAKAGYV